MLEYFSNLSFNIFLPRLFPIYSIIKLRMKVKIKVNILFIFIILAAIPVAILLADKASKIVTIF